MTPSELRAQADAMEAEAARALRGSVYVSDVSGVIVVHDGHPRSSYVHTYLRRLTEAEVLALRTIIPEVDAMLKELAEVTA